MRGTARAVAAHGHLLILLLAGSLSGCAWFQDPMRSGTETTSPESQPSELGLISPERAAELLTQVRPGADSTAAVPDTLTTTVPTDSTSVAAGADSTLLEGLPDDTLQGPDRWDLTGGELAATTGPGGQALHVTRPVITHRDLVVTAESGDYLVELREARLDGGVRYTEPDFVGSSDRATYYRDSETMIGSGNVVLEGDSLRIASDQVRYERSVGRAYLTGGVDGKRGNRRMIAQSAEWDRAAETVTLIGGVIVSDSVAGTTVTGDRLIYDLKQDRAQVTDQPQLDLTSTTDGVIRITGDRLWLGEAGEAFAAGSVEVRRHFILATADSAAYFDSLGVARLLGSPRVVERDGVMEGDTLSLFFDEDRNLQRAEVHGHASMIYTPSDSLRRGERSTVRGDSLTLVMGDAGAERVIVFGNATSDYQPSFADSSTGAGTNTAKGDSITIELGDDGVESVRIAGNAEGVYRFKKLATEAPADTSAESAEETVSYSAHEVIYALDERTVNLRDEARLVYGTLTLTAGTVMFYADQRYLEAEDNPTLVDATGGGQQVTGKHMDYSLESQEGNIDGGLTRAEDGFITSDRLRRIGDTQFIARGGSYTTCNLAESGETPHFRFQSTRMRIYLEDKVVARPVTLYIRDVPVFLVPFYVFSIRRGRQSGFLTPSFDFGFGSTGPGFANLGYYWAANDYSDVAGWMDYRSDVDVLTGWLRANYAVRYLLSGTAQVGRTFGNSTSNWDITGAHSMTLGEWRLSGRAEFRDRDFRSQQPLGSDFGNRVDRILDSNFSVTRNFSGASFSASVRRRQDLAADPTDLADEVTLLETLPEYRLSFSPIPLGRQPDSDGLGGRLPFLSNLRLTFSTSGSSTRTITEQTTITEPDTTGLRLERFGPAFAALADTSFSNVEDRSSRAIHSLSLTDTRNVSYLNVSPSISFTDHMVDREFSATDTTKGFNNALTWRASVGANTQLYGDFGGVGPLQTVRHTLRPSVAFNYSPDFAGLTYTDASGVTRNKYPGVSASESRFLTLGLTNRLQAKVKQGEVVRPVQLFNWSLGTSYNFVAADAGLPAWTDIGSQFDIAEVKGIKFNFNSIHDPYKDFRFKSFNSSAFFGLNGTLPGASGTNVPTTRQVDEDQRWRELGADVGSSRGMAGSRVAGGDALTWDARFGFSFDGARDALEDFGTTARLTTDFGFQITQNWFVSYANQWDITNGDVAAESIALKRDLHCWEAEFRRNRLNDDTTFWFRINIKSMPDIKYEQGPSGGSGLSGLTNALP